MDVAVFVVSLYAFLIFASHWDRMVWGMAATWSGYAMVGITLTLIPYFTMGGAALVLLISCRSVSNFAALTLICDFQDPSESKYTPSDLISDE